MAEFKKVELTSNDVISESTKSLADLIFEAKKTALKEQIIANTVIIDKTFAKVNDIHFVVGRDILHIPPMICGLEVRLTDELPDGYAFALVEAPETERERIARTAKAEIAREIFEEFEEMLLHHYEEWDFCYYDDSLGEAFAELKKKYTEGK